MHRSISIIHVYGIPYYYYYYYYYYYSSFSSSHCGACLGTAEEANHMAKHRGIRDPGKTPTPTAAPVWARNYDKT